MKRSTISRLPLPPGPRGLPIIGNLHKVLGADDPHIIISRIAQRYGDVALFHFGRVPLVVLSHPNVIKEASGKDELSERWIAEALGTLSAAQGLIFGSYDERWRQLSNFTQRQMFSVQDIAMLGRNHFERTIDETVERIGRMADTGEPVPLHKVLFDSAFNLTFRSLFGWDEIETNEFLGMKEELLERVAWFEAAASKPSPADYLPGLQFLRGGRLTKSRFQRDRRDALIDWFVEQVQKRRGSNPLDPSCWVDIMLDREASGNLDRDVTRALCMDMLGAVPSGVGAASTWSILLVANRPEVMDNVHNELDKTVGRNSSPNEDHRTLLPYTFACVAESLRHHSVAPIGIPHSVSMDTAIGGYRVKAGSQVWMNSWSVHHDPRFWDAPDEFVPERFLPQADGSPSAALSSPAYMPFGVGIRRCTGDHFAVSAIWLLTVRILHQFHLEPVEGLPAPEDEVFGLSTAPKPTRFRAVRRY